MNKFAIIVMANNFSWNIRRPYEAARPCPAIFSTSSVYLVLRCNPIGP